MIQPNSGLTRVSLGVFITEALHPFNVFKKAGFEVDLVSETGTYSPDWLSQQKDWLPDEDRKVWEDHDSEFRSKMDKLPKPSDIDPSKVIMDSLFPTMRPRLPCLMTHRLMLWLVVWHLFRLGRSRFFDRLS